MISPKPGDTGQTTWRNVRVSKTSSEIQFLGLLDQAMAELSLARVIARKQDAAPELQSAIAQIQAILSTLCGILAADVHADLLTHLIWCDKQVMSFEFNGFVDFGERSELAARLNLARTTVRLAESHLISACDDQDPLIRPLINRLSYVLFALAVKAG